uniref:Endothelial differentiation related factor 1 n=1 Tax=Cyprinus carpio TaxID=7962 RepID=A0A8C2CQB1_CYPCA
MSVNVTWILCWKFKHTEMCLLFEVVLCINFPIYCRISFFFSQKNSTCFCIDIFCFLNMYQHDSCCYILHIISILRINLCNLTRLMLLWCRISGSAGQNKQHLVTKNTAKLDRETEELHHQRVPLEVGKVIQKGRQDKGLTQKDLATKINEKPQIIAEYESGKAIPNNQVMGKIERAIGKQLFHSAVATY